eukprot:c35866_g1_i1.p1 GENE.c35866_g1_i1~~c35866_g1_i1.p1  ORF type:complete len:147 (-),score=23.68 c35866_g1_i1:233-673(-)
MQAQEAATLAIKELEALGPRKKLARKDKEFLTALLATNAMCVITDMGQHDDPIVYASESFQEFTGYSMNEIIGVNCRFLSRPAAGRIEKLTAQEQASNDESLERIRTILALHSRVPFCVSLVRGTRRRCSSPLLTTTVHTRCALLK